MTKMNKYQEALWNIVQKLNKPYEYSSTDNYGQDLNILQELVDKATPKKPVGYNYEHDYTYFSHVRYYCPSCENKVEVKNTYCPHCGQKLDWSEEND